MKLKISLGDGGAKEFLAQHVEKMVLGLACLIMFVLLFFGYRGRVGIDPGKTPGSLKDEVARVTQSMEAERWDTAPFKAKRDRSRRFTERAEEALTEIPIASYPVPVPWKLPVFPPQTKRIDPKLFTVREIEVKTGYGALAVLSEDGDFDFERESRRSRSGELEDLEETMTRPLPPEQAAKLDKFYKAQRGSAEPKGTYFVSITGLIPYKEQSEQFDQCFIDAVDYDPYRDFPKYIAYRVERREVSADGTEQEWTVLDLTAARRSAAKWADQIEEIADDQYVISALAFEIPPVDLRAIEEFALHSKIPRKKPDEASRDEITASEAEFDRIGGPIDLDNASDIELQARQPSLNTEVDNSWRGQGRHLAGGDEMSRNRLPITDFKLFRFYDFTVQPGKSYQYRIQLALEDPNYPQEESLQPTQRSLSTDVAARLAQKAATVSRQYWRTTDWSDPSAIVRVNPGHQVLAGAVTPPRTFSVDGSTVAITYPGQEPTAQAMTVQWDHEKAADVPGETTVRRGSAANFVADVWSLQPIVRELRKLEAYEFRTNTLVLDLRGGDPLPGRDRKDVIASPGEMLLMDASGNLIVRNELDDAEDYSLNLLKPEEEFVPEVQDVELDPKEFTAEERAGRRGRGDPDVITGGREEPSGGSTRRGRSSSRRSRRNEDR